ncbi:MAG: serine/threonine-protein phosphatase [Prevotella sp.]|nr:serine/threonine-protein phosphatase [Prevotella sp.]
MMILDITAASYVGCVRKQNEDMVLVGSHIMRDDKYFTQVDLNGLDRFLIAIADGMGGHNRGDVASSDVLHNLQFFYHDMPIGLKAGDFNEAMVGWLDSINNYVASKGRADEQYKGMGTTLVAFAYYCGAFFTMNCGDSRLYRFREGELTQLTTDHSLSNMLGTEKHSSIITNCIGGGCGSSFIDIVQISDDIHHGDQYLLCSDGLTDMLSDKTVNSLLSKGSDAPSLCDAAIAAGGFDNVSCCVISVNKEGGALCH